MINSLFRTIGQLFYEELVLELKKNLIKGFNINRQINVEFMRLPNKARTTLNRDGTVIMQFDLNQHHNKDDVITSVYHEMRHVMQYDFADMKDIIRWKELGEHDPNWYYQSPYEIDARIFAKRRGKVEGINIIKEIGQPTTWPPNKDFFTHTLDVCHKYKDLGPFDEFVNNKS